MDKIVQIVFEPGVEGAPQDDRILFHRGREISMKNPVVFGGSRRKTTASIALLSSMLFGCSGDVVETVVEERVRWEKACWGDGSHSHKLDDQGVGGQSFQENPWIAEDPPEQVTIGGLSADHPRTWHEAEFGDENPCWPELDGVKPDFEDLITCHRGDTCVSHIFPSTHGCRVVGVSGPNAWWGSDLGGATCQLQAPGDWANLSIEAGTETIVRVWEVSCGE